MGMLCSTSSGMPLSVSVCSPPHRRVDQRSVVALYVAVHRRLARAVGWLVVEQVKELCLLVGGEPVKPEADVNGRLRACLWEVVRGQVYAVVAVGGREREPQRVEQIRLADIVLDRG